MIGTPSIVQQSPLAQFIRRAVSAESRLFARITPADIQPGGQEMEVVTLLPV